MLEPDSRGTSPGMTAADELMSHYFCALVLAVKGLMELVKMHKEQLECSATYR